MAQPAEISAFHPAHSVFVSANAGAGKTRLLTNRVLSLLLHGVEPAKILCLTYTNAAAAEMHSRIQEELGRWVMANNDKLKGQLSALLGDTPPPFMMTRARGLFTQVLESPEGIRIQTIHGFCQSMLRRFPLEAAVSPHFKVMDKRSEQEMLDEASLRMFNQSDGPVQEAIRALATALSEQGWRTLLAEVISNKSRFQVLFEKPMETIIRELWRSFGMRDTTTLPSLLEEYFNYDAATRSAFSDIIKILARGTESETHVAQLLAQWIDNATVRPMCFKEYSAIFLTKKGGARESIVSKKTIPDNRLMAVLQQEQVRVLNCQNAFQAYDIICNTIHLLHFAKTLLDYYSHLKHIHALLDYDDLILNASHLLKRSGMAAWVLYKLDGGIDHVLVDEAQDTSPGQWEIIQALTEDFFSGMGKEEGDRSLFIVGDEKQSIFSFQGADVAALARMRAYFSERITHAAKPLQSLSLTQSFRSTREVLQAVDTVFAIQHSRQGLTFDNQPLSHIPTRLASVGLVEVWPLITPQEDDRRPPVTILAHHIADAIHSWITRGMWLESKNRKVEPGDIMILVRSRTRLVDTLVRALKRRNIPVAGTDRMQLNENLAVRDLLALGQFLLLPEDDLTLAALLKSPICNVGEDDLFSLAWQRGQASIWQQLQQAKYGAAVDACALLTDLRAKADHIPPFEIFSYVLDKCGARRRFMGRMGIEYADAIDEFLNQSLLFSRNHVPSLQGFLHWFTHSESEIKRDMEQSGNVVRIMTVHGAKGLEAPIVILPDTASVPKLRETVFWRDQSPVWLAGETKEYPVISALKEQRRQAMLEEYRRLLYVALTRAEDQLYICGATGTAKVLEESWYHLITSGLAPVATSSGAVLRLGEAPPYRTKDAAPASSPVFAQVPKEVFAFLHQAPPVERIPPKPLSPSRFTDEEPAAASPLSQKTLYARGQLIHRLLQYLPAFEKEQQERLAVQLSADMAMSLSDEERQHCIREAMSVIRNEEYGFLFGRDSLAEVPVAGTVEMAGKPVHVSGQMDRLYLGKEEIWVVDFKSHRLPPANIPQAYLSQMALYKLLLARIYPGKRIRCALLWTAEPKMVELDEASLSAYI